MENKVLFLIALVAALICMPVLSAQPPAASLRGPYPILSVPYHADGALDAETLVAEAQFVARCGVNGFIWAQSNDAIDLLTPDERKEGFDALAQAFEVLETGASKVTVVPREQLGSFALVPGLERMKLSGKWAHTPEFKDQYLSERLRLQLWTLRIEE